MLELIQYTDTLNSAGYITPTEVSTFAISLRNKLNGDARSVYLSHLPQYIKLIHAIGITDTKTISSLTFLLIKYPTNESRINRLMLLPAYAALFSRYTPEAQSLLYLELFQVSDDMLDEMHGYIEAWKLAGVTDMKQLSADVEGIRQIKDPNMRSEIAGYVARWGAFVQDNPGDNATIIITLPLIDDPAVRYDIGIHIPQIVAAMRGDTYTDMERVIHALSIDTLYHRQIIYSEFPAYAQIFTQYKLNRYAFMLPLAIYLPTGEARRAFLGQIPFLAQQLKQGGMNEDLVKIILPDLIEVTDPIKRTEIASAIPGWIKGKLITPNFSIGGFLRALSNDSRILAIPIADILKAGPETQQFWAQQAQANPTAFVEYAAKQLWQIAFGDEYVRQLLRILPKGMADEARNALTHNANDRTTAFFKTLVDSDRFRFTPDDMKVVLSYVEKYGLSTTPTLYGYYSALFLHEHSGQALPADFSIPTLAALDARIQTVQNFAFGHEELIDPQSLSGMDLELLSVVTGHSVHRFVGFPMKELVDMYTNDREAANVAPLPNGYTSTTVTVPRAVVEGDLTKNVSLYQETRDDILASLDDRATGSIDTRKQEVSDAINAELSRLQAAVADKKVGVSDVESQMSLLLAMLDQVKAATSIDDLLGVLLPVSYQQYPILKKAMPSLFRRMILQKMWSFYDNSDYGDTTEALLNEPMSYQGLIRMLDIYKNYLKDHVLNLSQDNKAKYWTDAAFTAIRDNRKTNDLLDIVASRVTQLDDALSDMKLADAQGSVRIEMIPDRGFIGELSGYLGNVCYTQECPLLATYPNITPFKFVAVDPDTGVRSLIGSVLVFEVPDANGKPVMIVRAFDVSDESVINVETLFEAFVNHLDTIAHERGIEEIGLGGTLGTISNYPIITHYVETHYANGGEKIALAQPFTFNNTDITDRIFVARDFRPVPVIGFFSRLLQLASRIPNSMNPFVRNVEDEAASILSAQSTCSSFLIERVFADSGQPCGPNAVSLWKKVLSRIPLRVQLYLLRTILRQGITLQPSARPRIAINAVQEQPGVGSVSNRVTFLSRLRRLGQRVVDWGRGIIGSRAVPNGSESPQVSETELTFSGDPDVRLAEEYIRRFSAYTQEEYRSAAWKTDLSDFHRQFAALAKKPKKYVELSNFLLGYLTYPNLTERQRENIIELTANSADTIRSQYALDPDISIQLLAYSMVSATYMVDRDSLDFLSAHFSDVASYTDGNGQAPWYNRMYPIMQLLRFGFGPVREQAQAYVDRRLAFLQNIRLSDGHSPYESFIREFYYFIGTYRNLRDHASDTEISYVIRALNLMGMPEVVPVLNEIQRVQGYIPPGSRGVDVMNTILDIAFDPTVRRGLRTNPFAYTQFILQASAARLFPTQASVRFLTRLMIPEGSISLQHNLPRLLLQYGINQEESDALISAWNAGPYQMQGSSPGVYNPIFHDQRDYLFTYEQNILAIERLEKQRPGATAVLMREFGIRNFARYPTDMLVAQYDQRNDTSLRYGVIINPVGDWNGAFLQKIPMLMQFFTAITDHIGWTHEALPVVRIIEVDGKKEMAQRLNDLSVRYGATNRIEFGVIGGHGSADSITFGDGSNVDHSLTKSDLFSDAVLAPLIRRVFIDYPSIIFDSCDNGTTGGLMNEASGVLQWIGIASPRQTTLVSITPGVTASGHFYLIGEYANGQPVRPNIFIDGTQFRMPQEWFTYTVLLAFSDAVEALRERAANICQTAINPLQLFEIVYAQGKGPASCSSFAVFLSHIAQRPAVQRAIVGMRNLWPAPWGWIIRGLQARGVELPQEFLGTTPVSSTVTPLFRLRRLGQGIIGDRTLKDSQAANQSAPHIAINTLQEPVSVRSENAITQGLSGDASIVLNGIADIGNTGTNVGHCYASACSITAGIEQGAQATAVLPRIRIGRTTKEKIYPLHYITEITLYGTVYVIDATIVPHQILVLSKSEYVARFGFVEYTDVKKIPHTTATPVFGDFPLEIWNEYQQTGMISPKWLAVYYGPTDLSKIRFLITASQLWFDRHTEGISLPVGTSVNEEQTNVSAASYSKLPLWIKIVNSLPFGLGDSIVRWRIDRLTQEGEVLRSGITPSMSTSTAQPIEERISELRDQIDTLAELLYPNLDSRRAYLIPYYERIMMPASGGLIQNGQTQNNNQKPQRISLVQRIQSVLSRLRQLGQLFVAQSKGIRGWWLTHQHPVSYDELLAAVNAPNQTGDQLLMLFESYVNTELWRKDTSKPDYYGRSATYMKIWPKIIDQANFQLGVINGTPADARWGKFRALYEEAVAIDHRTGIDLSKTEPLDANVRAIERKQQDTKALSSGSYFGHGTYSWLLPNLISSGRMMSPNGRINAKLLAPGDTPRLEANHWTNGAMFFYDFPNDNPNVVPGAYAQNEGPQGPAQESDVAIYVPSITLSKHATYVGVDRQGKDEYWISNAKNAPKDPWGQFGKNQRETMDDTSEIPVSQLYFVIPADIASTTLDEFRGAGYTSEWISGHVYVLEGFHSHKPGELSNTHRDVLVRNQDKILAWLQKNTPADVSTVRLETEWSSGPNYVYKREMTVNTNDSHTQSAIRTLVTNDINLAQRAVFADNPTLSGQAVVDHLVTYFETQDQAYMALFENSPNGLTRDQFFAALRPSLKTLVTSQFQKSQIFENTSNPTASNTKMDHSNLTVTEFKKFLFDFLFSAGVSVEIGNNYFQNFTKAQFLSFINQGSQLFWGMGKYFDWTFPFWRLSDFAGSILGVVLAEFLFQQGIITIVEKRLSSSLANTLRRFSLVVASAAVMAFGYYWEFVTAQSSGKPFDVYDMVAYGGGIVAYIIANLWYQQVLRSGWSLMGNVVRPGIRWAGRNIRKIVPIVIIGLLAVAAFSPQVAHTVQTLAQEGCFAENPFVEQVYAQSGGSSGSTCPTWFRKPRDVAIEDVDRRFKRGEIESDFFRMFINLGVTTALVYRIYAYYVPPEVQMYNVTLPPYHPPPPPVAPGAYCKNGPCSGSAPSQYECDTKTNCYELKNNYSDTRCTSDGKAVIARTLDAKDGYFVLNTSQGSGVIGCDNRGCANGRCIGAPAAVKDYPDAVSCDTLPPQSAYSAYDLEDSAYLPATPCKNAAGGLEWRIGLTPDTAGKLSCSANGISIVDTSTNKTAFRCARGSQCDATAGSANCYPTQLVFNYLHSSNTNCSPYQTRNDGLICTPNGLRCTPGRVLPKTTEHLCDRLCTDGNPDTTQLSPVLNCATIPDNYTEYTCKSSFGSTMVYKSNPVTNTSVAVGICPTNQCGSACIVKQNDSCRTGDVQYALSNSDHQCLMQCVNGKYQETGMCGKGLEVLANNDYQRMLSMKALSLLPAAVLDGAYSKVILQYRTPYFNPYITAGGGQALPEYMQLSQQPPDVLDISANSLVIHEFMHEYGMQQAYNEIFGTVPTWVPFANDINDWAASSVVKQYGGALSPIAYVQMTGCHKNGAHYTYGSGFTPVTGYHPDNVDTPCGEDFADSGAWYVTNACKLKKLSPQRYDYFKTQVFSGKEYLPSGGCTAN